MWEQLLHPWPTWLCNWMGHITTLVWISSLPRTYLSPCCLTALAYAQEKWSTYYKAILSQSDPGTRPLHSTGPWLSIHRVTKLTCQHLSAWWWRYHSKTRTTITSMAQIRYISSDWLMSAVTELTMSSNPGPSSWTHLSSHRAHLFTLERTRSFQTYCSRCTIFSLISTVLYKSHSQFVATTIV